jgi:hypothetical protein
MVNRFRKSHFAASVSFPPQRLFLVIDIVAKLPIIGYLQLNIEKHDQVVQPTSLFTALMLLYLTGQSLFGDICC